MHLDGVHGHDELASDLLVGEASRGELGRSLLGLGQLAGRPRSPRPHPRQLGAHLLSPARRADLIEGQRRPFE